MPVYTRRRAISSHPSPYLYQNSGNNRNFNLRNSQQQQPNLQKESPPSSPVQNNQHNAPTQQSPPHQAQIPKEEPVTPTALPLPAPLIPPLMDPSEERPDSRPEPKWMKGTRLTKAQKKRKLNMTLSRLVAPKSALMLLHELRPSSTYRLTESCNASNPTYLAEVLIDGNVVACGHGSNKIGAKTSAAETALKTIISQMIKEGAAMKSIQAAEAAAKTNTNPTPNTNVNASIEDMDTDEKDDNVEPLPWVGLASYAMHKMFTEWQQEGLQLPLMDCMELGRVKKSAAKPKDPANLPANAAEMHPTALLNQMRPDAAFLEVSRVLGPDGNVTVAIEVDGTKYQATARNRKDARKEASKQVITALYGITYNE